MKKNILKNVKGFTLIEVMVAVSIFTVVVTIGIGALMSVVSTNKKIQAQREVINGLSFALESMGRKIRVSPSVNAAGTSINITDADSGSFFNYQLMSNGRIGVSNSGTTLDVTPAGFTVTKFEAVESGTPAKKLITIRIVGSVNTSGSDKPISLQTSISPRSL